MVKFSGNVTVLVSFLTLLNGALTLKKLFRRTLKGKNLLQTFNQEWIPSRGAIIQGSQQEMIGAGFHSGKTYSGRSTKPLSAEYVRNSYF